MTLEAVASMRASASSASAQQIDASVLRKLADHLGYVAVATHPSVLTPQLLQETEALLQERGVEVSVLRPWQKQWESDESARRAVEHNQQLLTTKKPPLWIQGEVEMWWVELDAETNRLRVIPLSRLKRWANQSLPEGINTVLPSFASVEVMLGDIPLTESSDSHERLGTISHGSFQFVGALANPTMLYARQREQSLWLAALLACTFAAGLAGLWTMRRSLLKERRLSELKSNFVSSVSHELRAPVASMRLMAENLESRAVTDEHRREEYHRLIAEECRRLGALIDNVLDFARIEQDRKVYHFAETDAAALVRDTHVLMQNRAAQRQQEICAEIQTIDPPPCIDALAVRQALINLLDNAIKFSAEKTQITVMLRPRDSREWEIAVADQGIGIPTSEQEKIFERFYRIGSELRRETQGAGIGLSIVKHIAQAHGGRIEVKSEPGKGAVFSLILPLVPMSDGNRDT